jgi:tRNA A-37 threonylcarbamoyl transferase component Bud32
MIRVNRLFVALFCTILPIQSFCLEETDQQYIDATVRDIFINAPLSYAPLHGGALAQVDRVTIEPSACVVRKINQENSLESVVQECVVADLCAAQKIGPLVYAQDPVRKILILEYLPSNIISREQFGTKSLLNGLGCLLSKFHAFDIKHIEAKALSDYNCFLEVKPNKLFVFEHISKIVHNAATHLQVIGLTAVEIQQCVSFFEQQLHMYQSKIVFSHGDLHWGNCLYAKDRIWFIDYELSGLAPWWYDLGVLAAHFSFTEESDDFLLEGYFGKSKDQINAEDKEQYLRMKYMAYIFYAVRRLSECSLEIVQQAAAVNADLVALQDAYRNNTFSLNSEYARVQLSIAMIRHVGEIYKKIVAA